MKRGSIKLEDYGRYSDKYVIPGEKVQKAIKKATDKLLIKLDEFENKFPGACSDNAGKYKLGENTGWTQGMHTGAVLLAYELTGNEKFLEYAKKQIDSYYKRLESKKNLWSHDVGFAPASQTQ